MKIKIIFISALVGFFAGCQLLETSPQTQCKQAYDGFRDAEPMVKRYSAMAWEPVKFISIPPLTTQELSVLQIPPPKGQPLPTAIAWNSKIDVVTQATPQTFCAGVQVLRLGLEAADVASLILGFDKFYIPGKSTLFIYTENGDVLGGPWTAEQNLAGALWTSKLASNKIILELTVPGGITKKLKLQLASVHRAIDSR